MAALVQNAISGSVTTDPSASFGSPPTEGNVLHAIIVNRSGTDPDLFDVTSSGWTLLGTHNVSPGNTQTRRSIAVWEKVAGPSEPSLVETDTPTGCGLLLFEYSGLPGTFLEINFADNGDTEDGDTLAIGPSSDFSGYTVQRTANVWNKTNTGSATGSAGSWTGITDRTFGSNYIWGTQTFGVIFTWSENDEEPTGTLSATGTSTSGGFDDNVGLFGYQTVYGFEADTPTLTDVNGDETVQVGETGISVTGLNMGTTNANRQFSIVQGPYEVDQTETGVGTETAATLSLVFETAGDDLRHGAAELWITRDDTEADFIDIEIEPETGHLYVDLVSLHPEPSERITANPALAVGDQIEARGEGGGSVPAGLFLNDDATPGFADGTTPANFEARAYDDSDGTWGNWELISVAGDDASGEASLGFTTQATLIAAASVTAAPALTIDMQGDLSSDGPISAETPLGLGVVGDVHGQGDLTAQIPIVTAPLASLDAVGSIAAEAAMVLSPGGNIVGAGALTALGEVVFTPDPQASGSGSIAAQPELVFTVMGQIAGVGEVTAEGELVFTPAAHLVGQGDSSIVAGIDMTIGVEALVEAKGQLECGAALTFAATPSLVAHGHLDAALNMAFQMAALAEAAGMMEAVATLTVTPAAAWRGQGDLAAQGALAFEGIALPGNFMSAAASMAITLAAEMQGSGVLAALGQVAITVAPSPSVPANHITAAPTLVFGIDPALQGVGRVEAAAALAMELSAALDKRDGMTSTVSIELAGAAGLVAQGEAESAVSMVMDALATLDDGSLPDFIRIHMTSKTMGITLTAKHIGVNLAGTSGTS